MNINFPKHIITAKHNKAVNEDTLHQFFMLKPNKVVDIGAGDGFYGKLVKYCLPNTLVFAVEKRADYIVNWKLDEIYDEVINADIVDIIDELDGDLIIFGDILEHLEKENMVKVLNKAVKRFKNVIVNSPVGFQPQKHKFPEEIHRCGIDRSDFEGYQIIEYHSYCNDTMFNCLLQGR